MPIAGANLRLIVSSFRGRFDFYLTDLDDTLEPPRGLEMGVERPTKRALIEGLRGAGLSVRRASEVVSSIVARDPALLHDASSTVEIIWVTQPDGRALTSA
jgi:hypothetical protein